MDPTLIPEMCGCCEPPASPTPLTVTNRPGLSAVAYRIGTWSAFRQAMLEALAREPALRALTTRESDDPAITLLELWAAVADVLTFYQERIANEAFLRTARERDSVLRLAHLLDYHLRPGLAATTNLAFTLDDGATVRIPVGLRVMSIPGQDERPQFFETVEAFTADARINRLRILPRPVAANPLALGSRAALLPADDAGFRAAAALAPGEHVVLFDTTATTAPEEKEVATLVAEGDRFRVAWSGPVVGAGWSATAAARLFKRKVRMLGHDAPASFATVVPNSATPPVPVWASATTPMAHTGSELPLDTVYKDVAVGDTVLLHEAGAAPRLLTVAGLAEGDRILGTLPAGSLADHRYRAHVTVLSVAPASLSITDRRNVTIYVLKEPPVPLWPAEFPAAISAGRLYVPAVRLDPAGEAVEIGRTIVGRDAKPGVAIRLEEIEPGRTVLLEDRRRQPAAAVVTARAVERFQNQDFLVLEVASPAPIPLEAPTAVLLGNVARATHGETVLDEILGDGDTSVAFQRFVLRKPPLTYVPSARSARGESTLRVLVNGEQWTEVESLFGQPPTAAVYTARQADDGTTLLQFGDGVTGARLPSGRGNVVARYRQGLGREGRVRTDQLSIPMERPVGLTSVTNPAAAEGGADPERLEQAREVAPTTVKTFGRAVSLLDFESLATASGEVARAKATWVWRQLERAVHLTVAGPDGASFSAEALRRLHSGLTQQRDPNHPLLLGNVTRVPIVVTARLTVEVRFVRDAVAAAARRALVDAFAFERVAFGQAVHLSDVYRILQEVPGVEAVDIDVLHFKGFSAWTPAQLAARGATAAPVQSHLRIFAARALPPPSPLVLPAEQAVIERPADDVTLTAEGGLE